MGKDSYIANKKFRWIVKSEDNSIELHSWLIKSLKLTNKQLTITCISLAGIPDLIDQLMLLTSCSIEFVSAKGKITSRRRVTWDIKSASCVYYELDYFDNGEVTSRFVVNDPDIGFKEISSE